MKFSEYVLLIESSSGMQIRIVDHPVINGGIGETGNYRNLIQKYAGKILPVDTSQLFGDQFQTVSPSMRVMIKHVSDIINDIRPMAARCGYCNKSFLNVADRVLNQPCPACNKWPQVKAAVIGRIRPLITVENGFQRVLNKY